MVQAGATVLSCALAGLTGAALLASAPVAGAEEKRRTVLRMRSAVRL
jgi:hypothetical protein